LKEEIMGGTKDAVHLVIRCHESPRVAVSDRDLEGLQMNLSKRPVGNLFVDEEPTSFLVVSCEMLDAGADSSALKGVDEGRCEFSGEKRVFAVCFEVAAS
jgi:hypothetical protein